MNKYVCPYLWNHLVVKGNGTVAPCCLYDQPYEQPKSLSEALTSPHAQSLRETVVAGEPLKGCWKCYHQEENGAFSMRQSALRLMYEFSPIETPKLRSVQVKPGTLCNSACISCSSGFSTRWVKDEKAMGVVGDHEMVGARNPMTEIDFTDVEHVKFVGGEPFLYEDQIGSVLERCKRLKSVQIVTNGTIVPSIEFQKALGRSRKIDLVLSIDAIGDKFEYIRYGSEWSAIENNIDILLNMHPYVFAMTNTVVQALNVLDLREILQWITQHGWRFTYAFLDMKEFLGVEYFPTEMKNEICERLADVPDDGLREGVIARMRETEHRPDYVAEFERYITTLDRLRGLDARSTFPEFFTLFDRYR